MMATNDIERFPRDFLESPTLPTLSKLISEIDRIGKEYREASAAIQGEKE